jgi:predicted SAM-dependent methyltransferase
MKFDDRFENKFDIISFIHGLEHFTIDDYPVILNNIKKYLKPNGIFTGALPFMLPFNFRICPHCGQPFEIDGHVSIHNLETLRKVFDDNGFNILHLNNFNLRYSIKQSSFIKKMYIYFSYYFLRNYRKSQIEYIVCPK